jgi:hypothetical protein
MKMVDCYECKKEIAFIDAKPLWNRLDREPDFLCQACSRGIRRCDDEMELAALISKKFIQDNQPERLSERTPKGEATV